MSYNETITSIDIGSSKIRTVIGKFDEENNNFALLGLGISSSNAIRKGNILDMEEFKNNLDKSLEEAEKMSGEQISGVYISFNSSSFEVITSKGIIAVSGEEITQDDINRVLDMAKSGIDLPNKEILKVIPEHFVVDFEDGVKNPLGMSARKLEVVANIFSMNTNVLSNIRKAVSDIGIEIYDVYPNLISSPEGILTKRQKELGVVCIDIGSSTTGLTVYEEGILKYSAVIPVGGDNVTNDIALGLRISTGVAEKLKFAHCKLNVSPSDKTEIDLSSLNVGEEGKVELGYLSQIITARYEEILFFVRDELKKIGKSGMLPEGAVFVGGGIKAKGFLELSKEILKLPSFIGVPSKKDDLADSSINDPVFSASIGTIILANKYDNGSTGFSFNIFGVFSSVFKVLKKILP